MRFISRAYGHIPQLQMLRVWEGLVGIKADNGLKRRASSDVLERCQVDKAKKGHEMGEYAIFKGEQVKIGTCESMYYLRASQARDVEPVAGSLDPWKDRLEIRFRFPFPDEDTCEPGGFDGDYGRGFNAPGFELGSDYTGHGTMQLIQTGWNVSLPCPLGTDHIEGVKIHRNGGSDGVEIVQQKYQESGELWTVVRCAACSGSWRLPWSDAERLVVALRSAADRQVYGREDTMEYYYGEERRAMMHEIAYRVARGYFEGQLGELENLAANA